MWTAFGAARELSFRGQAPDFKAFQECQQHTDQFCISVWAFSSKAFAIYLVELAHPPFLGPFVPKRWAPGKGRLTWPVAEAQPRWQPDPRRQSPPASWTWICPCLSMKENISFCTTSVSVPMPRWKRAVYSGWVCAFPESRSEKISCARWLQYVYKPGIPVQKSRQSPLILENFSLIRIHLCGLEPVGFRLFPVVSFQSHFRAFAAGHRIIAVKTCRAPESECITERKGRAYSGSAGNRHPGGALFHLPDNLRR